MKRHRIVVAVLLITCALGLLHDGVFGEPPAVPAGPGSTLDGPSVRLAVGEPF